MTLDFVFGLLLGVVLTAICFRRGQPQPEYEPSNSNKRSHIWESSTTTTTASTIEPQTTDYEVAFTQLMYLADEYAIASDSKYKDRPDSWHAPTQAKIESDRKQYASTRQALETRIRQVLSSRIVRCDKNAQKQQDGTPEN